MNYKTQKYVQTSHRFIFDSPQAKQGVAHNDTALNSNTITKIFYRRKSVNTVEAN